MDTNVSFREFDAFKDVVLTAIHEGFQGVHSRLDVTNGRVGKHDTEIKHLMERTSGHHSDISHLQGHQRKTDAPDVIHAHTRIDDATGDEKPITMGDIKRQMWIIGITVTVTIGAAVVVITMILDKAPK